jgi:Tol biopolymer transport system component/tRNA A-37 threonylcarbamoyl transferase component Bud32
MLGRDVIGQYVIQHKIGAGGMGAVYLADQPSMGRSAVIKVLHPWLSRDPEVATRFDNEARAVAKLSDPHIVQLFNYGDMGDGTLFLAMEHLDGRTLSQVLAAEGRLSVERAMHVALQVCEALAEAHRQGVVHRDLKPSNIMLLDKPGGELVKVLDFGVAKLAGSSQTTTGQPVGTPRYMSPEQLAGKGVDGRSDLYALGLVTYEMLAGQPPFEGKTAQAVLARHVTDPPPPLSTVRPQLPGGFDAVMQRALAKVPADRYASMVDFGAALDDPQGATRSGRGRRLTVGLVALALLVWIVVQKPWSGAPTIQPRRSVRVTFEDGPEYAATLSPDSRFLVYSHTRYGTMDLFIRAREGGEALRLTEGPGDEILPRWSPDGTEIAFVSGRGASYAIYRMAPTGGEPRLLVDTHIAFLVSFWDAINSLGSLPWSPDGSSLVFSRALPGGGVGVAQVDLETRDEKLLTSATGGSKDLSASWSFDGNSIVFSRARQGISQLWLVSPAGGDERVLLADEGITYEEPCFLPDDQHVVFRSDRGGNDNIWAVHIESGELTRLTFGGGKDQFPTVAPDGVISMTQFNHQTDLTELVVATGDLRRLTKWTQDNFGGRYSPDDTRIAYHSTRAGNAEIMILDLETGREVNLSDDPAMDILPAWSPDGREIAFISNRKGATHLRVADAESGQSRRLSDREIPIPSVVWGVSLNLRWTPDGDAIGYVDLGPGGPALWLVDREGGEARRLRGDVLRFDWFRDRHRIVYSTQAEDGMELRAADLRNGKDVLLHAGPHTEMILRTDGTAVAMVKSASHFDQHLFLLPLRLDEDGLPRAAGEPERLTDGEGRWHVHNGGFSSGGERIVFTRDEDDADIFLLLPEESD